MSASDFSDEVGPPPRSAVLVRLADVPPEPVKWLWKPYIPRRKITLVVGDPGDGKTWMVNAIAAAMTRGFGLPDAMREGRQGTASHPESVLYLTAEDGLADTIRPRLDGMGADCERFFALTAARDGDAETPVTLRDIDVLDDALTQTHAALAAVDPLQAFMGDRIDMHRANETRPVLAALARLAEKHECAVVCICHLSKATQSRALYRVLGSIDFAAAVRSVLLVGRDPEDRCRRAVVQIKNNLAPEGPTLAFTIDNDRFEWCGISNLTAGSLLAADAGDDERSARDEARAFLEALLKDGPVSAETVLKQARKAGVAERTLYRAKAELQIKSQKTACGWAWALPTGSTLPTLPHMEPGNLGNLDVDEGVIS
jgi:hypothetical protein